MTATTYRGRGYRIGGGLRFRAADGSGIEHVWHRGGDEYPEALAKWQAGYRFYNPSTGEFLRAATPKKPMRDWLSTEEEKPWRL